MGTMALSKYGIDLHKLFGLHFFLAPSFRIWQLITYMFLHEGFQHIFFNMFAVWMFGRIMEIQWGSKKFLLFYLICGIGAGLTQELCQLVQYEITLAGFSGDITPGLIQKLRMYMNGFLTVGASGAVYGILLGYGMTFPDNQLFIIPIPFPIKAKWLAHFAHLGGMLAGFLMLLYWKHKERKDNHIKFTW